MLTLWLLSGTVLTDEGAERVRDPVEVELSGGTLTLPGGTTGHLDAATRSTTGPGVGLMLVSHELTGLYAAPDSSDRLGLAWPGARLPVLRVEGRHAEVVLHTDPPITAFAALRDLGVALYPDRIADRAPGGQVGHIGGAELFVSTRDEAPFASLAPGPAHLLESWEDWHRIARLEGGIAVEGWTRAAVTLTDDAPDGLPWRYETAMPASEGAAALAAVMLAGEIWVEGEDGCEPRTFEDGVLWEPAEVDSVPMRSMSISTRPTPARVQYGTRITGTNDAQIFFGQSSARGWAEGETTPAPLNTPIVLCVPPPHTVIGADEDRLLLTRQYAAGGSAPLGYDPRLVIVWYRSRAACEGIEAVAQASADPRCG